MLWVWYETACVFVLLVKVKYTLLWTEMLELFDVNMCTLSLLTFPSITVVWSE